MTSQPHSSVPRRSRPPERTPAAIRAALRSDERAAFEVAYRAALTTAADTFDLTAVSECLDRWWPLAWSAADDPVSHRAAMDAAEAILAGHDVQSATWDEIAARHGLPSLP